MRRPRGISYIPVPLLSNPSTPRQAGRHLYVTTKSTDSRRPGSVTACASRRQLAVSKWCRSSAEQEGQSGGSSGAQQ